LNHTEEFRDLDILFLVPPVFRIMGKKWDAYPLGIGYLVATLDKINVRSAIYHANYVGADNCSPNESWLLYLSKKWDGYYAATKDETHSVWKELVHVIRTTNPKIVGISSSIVDIPSTDMVISLVKKTNPNIKIIVGGPSATTYSEKLLQNPQIDVLVMGEGERTISELVPLLLEEGLNWDKLEKVKGIKYRVGGNDNIEWAITTDRRELIEDIDDIPFPNRDRVFIVNPLGELEKIYLVQDVLLARGCPFKCKFCSAFTVWGTRKPRIRSNVNIIQELTELKTKYNQKQFIFWDDLFTVNKKRVESFCNDLIARNLNIKWVCLARIDTVDKGMLELMKRAGCMEVQFGVESGTDRILKLMNKGITVEQIKNTAKIIRESGITWRIFLIIGLPTETEQEICETIKFIDILQPDSVDLSVFAPYPGTELYEELLKSGKINGSVDKSDASYFEKNYTMTISENRFKELATYAFNYTTRHNNRIRGPYSLIIRVLTWGKWKFLKTAGSFHIQA
jgi:radical SAM superfamily enzyme YgiQ (UPF0313 family)